MRGALILRQRLASGFFLRQELEQSVRLVGGDLSAVTASYDKTFTGQGRATDGRVAARDSHSYEASEGGGWPS